MTRSHKKKTSPHHRAVNRTARDAKAIELRALVLLRTPVWPDSANAGAIARAAHLTKSEVLESLDKLRREGMVNRDGGCYWSRPKPNDAYKNPSPKRKS